MKPPNILRWLTKWLDYFYHMTVQLCERNPLENYNKHFNMSRSGKSRPGLALTQFCCRNLKEKENRYKSRDFRWIMCLSSSSSRKQGWVCILESFFCDFPRAPVYRVLFRSKQSGHIIKCLLTEFVRARQENILHSVIFGTSLRSVCTSWFRAKYFPSGPHT